MADGKWIPFLRPDMPVIEAARHALFVRLQVVADLLPRAALESHSDPEHVHQLRVGTRRAGAAVRIFRDCLPDKIRRRARKRLRELRWAAGLARDWDVLLLELAALRIGCAAPDQAGLDFLAGYAYQQRQAVQGELLAAGAASDFDFEPIVAAVITGLRRSGIAQQPLTALARPLLAELHNELEEVLTGNLDDDVHLHQVRIVGKRLRYAMEVFVGCFTAPFRDSLYPLIEELQEILGRINDSRVAGERLTALAHALQGNPLAQWQRTQPGIDALVRGHAQRLPRERTRFREWLARWRALDTRSLLQTHPASPPSGAASP